MPTVEEINSSDEEFQDALDDSDRSPTKPAAFSRTCAMENSASCCKSSNEGTNSEGGSCAKDEAVASTTIGNLIGDVASLDINSDDDNTKSKASVVMEDDMTNAEYVDDDIDEAVLKENENSLTNEELEANREKANSFKLKANELFKDGEVSGALESIQLYTEALKICPTKYNKERSILFANRAAAKMKLNSNKSAIDDCSKAIDLWPEYVRVLLRRAKLYETTDKLDEALADYKRIYELDPGRNEAREAMVRLPPLIHERNEHLKTEMMSKLKDLGNMILKPLGLSTNNFQMQKDPSTGSYSINFKSNS